MNQTRADCCLVLWKRDDKPVRWLMRVRIASLSQHDVAGSRNFVVAEDLVAERTPWPMGSDAGFGRESLQGRKGRDGWI